MYTLVIPDSAIGKVKVAETTLYLQSEYQLQRVWLNELNHSDLAYSVIILYIRELDSMAKEFQWDEEVLLDEVMASDKVKFEVKMCRLGDKHYISTVKWVLTKQGWSYPKNSTYPLEVFHKITGIVNESMHL